MVAAARLTYSFAREKNNRSAGVGVYPDSEFMISNGLAAGGKPRLSMSLDRLQKARQRLLDLKFIYRTRRGGGWDKRTTGSF
jgi:hypothetical protein